MLTEIAQAAFHECRGRLRHEHLPTVARCRDPCGTMNIHTHVAAIRKKWRTRVQSDPYANRPRCKLLGQLIRRSECCRGRLEREEERIALGIDFGTVVTGAGGPYHSPVGRQDIRVFLCTQLMEELRRTLHVGEQEGDSAEGRSFRTRVIIRLDRAHV